MPLQYGPIDVCSVVEELAVERDQDGSFVRIPGLQGRQ